MKTSRGMDVCYNVQLAVDRKHKLIASVAVTNEVTDEEQLAEMAQQAKADLGVDLVTPNELKPLEAGQNSWEAYRDHEFGFLAAMLNQKRGTMYIPIRIEYRIEVLKARALELERYLYRLKRLKGDS